MIGKTTRLLEVDVEVKTLVEWKTKSHFKHKKIVLITSYHPPSNYKGEETLKYNQQVISFIDMSLKQTSLSSDLTWMHQLETYTVMWMNLTLKTEQSKCPSSAHMEIPQETKKVKKY